MATPVLLSAKILQQSGIVGQMLAEKINIQQITKGINDNTKLIKAENVTLKKVEKNFEDIAKNTRLMLLASKYLFEIKETELNEIFTPRSRRKRIVEERKPQIVDKSEIKLPLIPRIKLFFKKPSPLKKPKPVKKRPTKKPRYKRRARIRRKPRRVSLLKRLRNIKKRITARIVKRRNYLTRIRTINQTTNKRVLQLREQQKRAQLRINRQIVETRRRLEIERRRMAAEINGRRQLSQIEIENRRRQANIEIEQKKAQDESRRRQINADIEQQRQLAETDIENKKKAALADIESQRRILNAEIETERNKLRIQAEDLDNRIARVNADVEKFNKNVQDLASFQEQDRTKIAELRKNNQILENERARLIAENEARMRENRALQITMAEEAVRQERTLAQLKKEKADVVARQELLAPDRQVSKPPSFEKPPTIQTAPVSQRPPVPPQPTVKALNPQMEELVRQIARSRFAQLTSKALTKLFSWPVVVAIGGGIALYQLAKGQATQATITAIQSVDPTFFLSLPLEIPAIAAQSYVEIFQVDPLLDKHPDGGFDGRRMKEIIAIKEEEWEKFKQNLKNNWKETKEKVLNQWKKDTERIRQIGLPQFIKESSLNVSPENTARERRRQAREAGIGPVAPGQGAVPVVKPRPGELLMPDANVGDAIRKAAELTGVSESILLAMAKQESTFNPNAKANTSSAKGLFQFLDSTWNEMLKKYGKDYPQLYAGPYDALASAIAGALYIKENSKVLERSNIEVNGANIYATHFLGPTGATRLLTANPNDIAASILPKAAEANKNVFYEKGDLRFPKTVAQVQEFLYGKVGAIAEQYEIALAQNRNGQEIGNVSANVNAARRGQNQTSNINLTVVQNNTTSVIAPSTSTAVEVVGQVGGLG